MIEVYENRPFKIPDRDRRFLSRILKLERRDSGWVVSHQVGHVALPSGETLRIRSPKATNASILTWAAYVDPTLSALRFLGTAEELSAPGDLAGLIARLFIRETLAAVARAGIVRQYHRVSTTTLSIRGKIDFARLARQGGELSRVPCIVWERLPETPLNRFLAEALRRVRQDVLMAAAVGRDLRQVQSFFANVRPVAEPDLVSGKTTLDRNEQPFTTACALARLILRHSALTEGFEHLGSSFLVNLDTLFERAVATAFRDAGVKAQTGVSLHYERRAARSPTDPRGGSFQMDLLVEEPPEVPLVVDAKYKSRISSDNLHQMISYCFLCGARRAVLVFPKGHIGNRRSFYFRNGFRKYQAPEAIRVDIAELDTTAESVAEWRNHGKRLVESILREPDHGAPHG